MTYQQFDAHILINKETELKDRLANQIARAQIQFPDWLDYRLQKGFERLRVNTPDRFIGERSLKQLQRLLITQFFLQKKIETVFEEGTQLQHCLFLNLFKTSSGIGLALVFHEAYRFSREQILKSFQVILPGILEIPRSFYLWHHPEYPYLFCYLEIQKLRGVELTLKELKKLARSLKEQLNTTAPLTPALFWPYNEEESFRQVQLLLKEMHGKDDLPHVSIQFQEQTSSSLEFLVHVARPKSNESLTKTLERLPGYLDFFCHFHRISKKPFPIELGAFVLKVPAHAFDVQDSINLLYARRYILKHLQVTLGACRDYNGGLFEKQQHHFEMLRIALSEKIPLFDLFAEKLFYALHPVEKRLMLTVADAEDLFGAFSNVMQGKEAASHATLLNRVMIVRSHKSSDLHRLSHLSQESSQITSQAQLSFGGYHYLCVLGLGTERIESLAKKNANFNERTKTLRLVFEEGKPISLNPYHSSSDMRCRLLSKLLFEGLTRLDHEGQPQLTGALSLEVTKDGTLYTFKLRPNFWSNGERVTAFDYVSGLKRALKDHISHPEIYYVIKNAQAQKKKNKSLKELGIRAIDMDTLQIELEHADSHFLHQLSQPSFSPLFGSMQEPKWFNGPYLVSEQNNECLLLEKNPYYWDTQTLFFEEIDIRWFQDADIIYEQFHAGKIDWIGDPLSTLPKHFVNLLKKEQLLHEQEASRRFILCFNTKHPVFSSASIRRAFSLCIDRKLICSTIFPYSIPADSPLLNEVEIRELFEKGLHEIGITRQDFPVLTFSYSHQTRREKLALYFQEVWQNVLGITIRLEKIEWNLFRNRLEQGSYEISATIQSTYESESLHTREKYEGNNSWNFSKWTNESYHFLIAQAKQETQPSKCANLLAQADQILSEEVPFSPLFKYTHLFAHQKELSGYLVDHEGCVDFSHSILKVKG